MLKGRNVCVHKLGSTLKEQMGFYRFLHHPQTTESSILRQLLSFQESVEEEEELLVISDTSQVNVAHLKFCIKDKTGLGVLNDGLTLGYYFHGSLVLSSDYQVKGISDALIFSRPKKIAAINKRKRDAVPMKYKESNRWWLGIKNSTTYLGNPSRLTFIQDREGDIYEVLDKIQKQGSKFIIRSKHNRYIRSLDGIKQRLKTYLSTLAIQQNYWIKVPVDKHANKFRKANLSIRYASLDLQAPTHHQYETDFSDQISCNVIQVFQANPIKAHPTINWIIFTNHPVQTKAQALKIINDYRSRWNIEEVFRGMKSKGLQVNKASYKTGAALRKIAIMGFDISTTALKLRQARDGKTFQAIEEVFDHRHQLCLKQLLPKFEGNTDKQKNPHSTNSLAWAAWIIARIGGWKGYQSQRPPGVITFKRGLADFQQIFIGWNIRYP